MILEMSMESLFAIVDIFFLSRVSLNAVATVALTESMIMIVYAIAIGFSMAATAMVARRIGEKDPEKASEAAIHAIYLAIIVSIIFSLIGLLFPREILKLMGAEQAVVNEGYGYPRIIFGGNLTIMLLFLINAIFRGAGDASIAMRALFISNGLNIILDPIFIFGLGPIPAFGVEGAAIATTIGRGIGVSYQLYMLLNGKSVVRLIWRNMKINWAIVREIISISLGGIGQYMIGTLSWLFLVRISAEFGSVVLAGYQIAFRIIIFTILPSWGLANAAATLVGQNLGANQPERAERSVWKCAFYNMIFLAIVSLIFGIWAEFFVGLFIKEAEVIRVGSEALRLICIGYIFYAYGMVISQAFNGAGDTRTPTIINFFCFWMVEVPLAYILAVYLGFGPTGIFSAITVAVILMAIVCILVFRRGAWKTVQV
jgi:putative MATE family efflux protein